MVGDGSVNHNSRKFKAANVDPTRTHLNIDYCNENIKKVYHELFDEALKRYNDKQTRADRKIKNYYDKICNSKQEKSFHEIILQIGNKDDMGAESENGQLAKQVLDEYYRGFQERNPQLKVFSAHLHMDEATPHIHIDFVPFTTGSKRGLDTRVSLKQALAIQGFKGGTRENTEWNQWIQSEKEQLAAVMERYGIEWEHKDTHEKHLSVLDYKKQERAAEVEKLGAEIEQKQAEFKVLSERIQKRSNKAKSSNDELDKRQSEILMFWEQFNQVVVNRGKPFNIRKATTDHWYDIAVGSSEAHIAINLVNKDGMIVVELYISNNKDLFDHLYKCKDDIESKLDIDLIWDRLDNKKASRIKHYIHDLNFDDHSNYDVLMNQAIDVAVRMRDVFKEYFL